jgi:hypothetical protein
MDSPAWSGITSFEQTRMKLVWNFLFGIVLVTAASRVFAADGIDASLALVAKVGPQAAGAREAQLACRELAKGGVEILPRLLTAMDTENVVAANWLRTVYDQIVEAELASKSTRLPVDLLKEFVREPQRQGRVRRHVLSTLDLSSPGFRAEFIPKCLDDPEFRADAVADALTRGDRARQDNKNSEAVAAYREAFQHARESSQITAAADKLAAVGQNVSIVEQMGLVVDWYVLGPFDAPEKTGFDLHFPPEEHADKVDLKAEYDGKDQQRITWKRYRTEDRLGSVDLVQALAPASEAVAYAFAELNATEAGPAQLRCGADDNLTVWLNGEKVFGREQWLNGIRLDRFVTPVRLKKGTNHLLVKVCQGPQHSNPAVGNNWTLQLRICRPDGAAAGLTSLLPAIEDGKGGK